MAIVLEILQPDEFRRWEQGLRDQLVRAAIAARLFRLANGLRGDVKSVGEGIHEIRIHYGPGFRLYFTMIDAKIVLLLCGGEKRRQQSDISRAKDLALNCRNKP